MTPGAEAAARQRAIGLPDAVLLEALHAAAFAAVPPDGSGAPPPWAEPWSASAFVDLLRLPVVFGRLRLDDTGEPVGFVLGQVVEDEAEILTLAVRPDRAGRGHGRALVESAVAEARGAGATVLHLEVASDNVPARALYARTGFTRIGLRRRYYARGSVTADALVLRRNLEGSAGFPPFSAAVRRQSRSTATPDGGRVSGRARDSGRKTLLRSVDYW